MRLCVTIDGEDLVNDVVVRSGEVELWFRLEPGYKVEPPTGVFSVDGRSARGAFPRLKLTPTKREYEVRFDSEPVAPPRAETTDATSKVAEDPPIVLTRTLIFVQRWQVIALALIGGISALLMVLCAWKLGIAAQNSTREVKSLWSLDALLPWFGSGVAIAAAAVGLSRSRTRRLLLCHFELTLLSAIAVGGFFALVQSLLIGVISNASPEKVSPFEGLAVELAPDSTTLFFRPWQKPSVRRPFKTCRPRDDAGCATADASLTAWLLRVLSGDTTVVSCDWRGNAHYFAEDELKLATNCKTDPSTVIARSHAQLQAIVERAGCEPACPAKAIGAASPVEASAITYDLRPFISNPRQRFDKLGEALVHIGAQPRKGNALTELVLDGHDLLEHVHLPLPAGDGLVAYGTWPAGEPALASGRVLIGSALIGSLACPHPTDGSALQIDFAPSRAHVRRISVEKLAPGDSDNGEFYQSYAVERPELVTHVPWCSPAKPSSAAAGDAAEYSIDLYLDDAWTPENWSITLPLRVAALHVHAAAAASAGKLTLRRHAGKRSSASPLTSVDEAPDRLELVTYSIPANVHAWEGQRYQWESYAAGSEARSTVWAMRDETNFNVQLWDGGRRKTSRATDFALESLPLRQCFIAKRTNQDLGHARNDCKESAAAWLKEFPHPDCSPTTSRLCAP
jgi:hypothetical protein